MTTATRPLPPHGERRCYLRGCRRDECVRAHARYCKAYKWRTTRLGGNVRVPAGPLAARVRAWHAAGWSHRQIAQAAGCSSRAIHNLLVGAVRTVAPSTAAAIARARIEAGAGPGGYLDPTGSRRRLQALAAAGWPLAETSRRAGISSQTGGRVLHQAVVFAGTAAAIAAAYDRLAHLEPEQHGVRPWVATKTRQWAARQGWPDPTWWEDYGGLDDPAAPEADEPEAATPRAVALAEDWEWLRDQGFTRQQAADRLGVHRHTLDAAISRVRQAGSVS